MGTLAIRNIVFSLIILIALISSIRIERLDVVREKAGLGKFDASGYAQNFWENELLPNLHESTEITYLLDLLRNDPENAFDTYSRALGIGNIRFFMVQGEGEIRHVGENDITVVILSDAGKDIIKIETEYIFGNAVRDASGRIDLQEFEQTMDFNNVSAEINQIIRDRVLPELKNKAEIGRKISFTGAIEMNKELVDIDQLKIIPVSSHFFGEESAYAGS